VIKTRKVRLLLISIVGIAVVAGVWLGLDTYPDLVKVHIDETGFHRIRPGMRLKNVETALGVPPGDYHLVSRIFRGDDPPEPEPVVFVEGSAAPSDDMTLAWCGDDGVIEVGTDEEGGVLWKKFVPWPGRGPGLLKRVLGTLGLW
jgi:hypothetical protein